MLRISLVLLLVLASPMSNILNNVRSRASKGVPKEGGAKDAYWCSNGCPFHWIGDGICDVDCNHDGCNFDGGDCDDAQLCNASQFEELGIFMAAESACDVIIDENDSCNCMNALSNEPSALNFLETLDCYLGPEYQFTVTEAISEEGYCSQFSNTNSEDESTDSDAITTTGGNAPEGSTCHFPFQYAGQAHYACTDDGHYQLWCFTDANQLEWGNCVGSISNSEPELSGYTHITGVNCWVNHGGCYVGNTILDCKTRCDEDPQCLMFEMDINSVDETPSTCCIEYCNSASTCTAWSDDFLGCDIVDSSAPNWSSWVKIGACGCEIEGETFCNFENGYSGNCQPCSDHDSVQSCYDVGLPSAGAQDCEARCNFVEESSVDIVLIIGILGAVFVFIIIAAAITCFVISVTTSKAKSKSKPPKEKVKVKLQYSEDLPEGWAEFEGKDGTKYLKAPWTHPEAVNTV